MAYECDNDNHDIGCQCPGITPDFTGLLKRDLLGYVKGLGFSDEDAERKATELLAFVMSEAERFT